MILIYSNTYQEHLEHIYRVLEVLREKNCIRAGLVGVGPVGLKVFEVTPSHCSVT